MNSDVVQNSPKGVRVLLADSRPMEIHLLAGGLRSQGFWVGSCEASPEAVLQSLENDSMDVLILGVPPTAPDISSLRTIHFACPQVPKMVLLDADTRQIVVQAFRSGARGILCLSDSSFPSFCEGIEQVHRGEIWASPRQIGYLLDSVCQTPSLQVLTASGEKLLTSREEQVVALVADGLSNRNVAAELGLSEHTVKKYLFRIFEKLGISNRVELVLYTFHHGASQHPQWVASA